MFPSIDIARIVSRLQCNVDHLLQINNHAFYLGRAWPEALWLTVQISNRIHICLGDLDKTIKELNSEPQKPGDLKVFEGLTVEELFEIVNLESSRQRIIEIWRHIESRKAEILQMAQQRRGI